MSTELRPPADEFIRFCECLNQYQVDYVIVGSEAVAFHGVPRYSADFDTFGARRHCKWMSCCS